MERHYIGKCPKCGTEIYSENGMASRFCTHCGTALGESYGGMAVAYMEKDETAEAAKQEANVRAENENARASANAAVTESSPLKFDTSIPRFDVTQGTDLYAIKQAEINEKNRKRAACIAGGVAALAIAITALLITSAIPKRNYNDVTEPVVTVEQNDPDIELVQQEPEVEEPTEIADQTENKKTITNIDDLTIPEKEAVRRASQLLSSIPYSKTELIETLQDEYYGFSESEATDAVAYMESTGLVSFKEEAARWAKTLCEDTSFSRAELFRMLTGEYSSHYTHEEAEYAVNYVEENNIVDWNEMAKKEAELYLSLSSKYTRQELIDQLMMGNDFTQSEAEYAANALGY